MPQQIFGFEPPEIPFSPPDHQLWSSPLAYQPLNPCSPWQRVESQCYRWCVRFCWSETAGGNVARWGLWASSWPPKKGEVLDNTVFDTTIQLSLRMHPIKTRAIFAKLNNLVIPWRPIGKIQSSLSSKRSGFQCFGKSRNSWVNFHAFLWH